MLYTSAAGIITNFELIHALVYDIHFLKDIKSNLSSSVLIGDKAYLSVDFQLDLVTLNQIKLDVPMRVNQYDYQK